MRRRSMPGRFIQAVLLTAFLGALLGATPAAAGENVATERWYENFQRGKKSGHSRVVWSPSTYEGKKTVHDTSVHVTRTVRNMAGHKDVFESTSTTDLERDDDGTLWFRRDRIEEAGRVTIVEILWTGKSYTLVKQQEGQGQKKEIMTDKPVMTDSESFFGALIRAGKLETGQKYKLAYLNWRKSVVEHNEVIVAAQEEIDDENDAKIECFKVVERNPASGTEMTLWIDGSGAFVNIESEGFVARRATAEKAGGHFRPAEYSITVPSNPGLERVFSADRTEIEVHLQGDESRKLPKYPDSPWSRVTGVTGSNADGWVIKAELTKYDDPEAPGTLPVEAKNFELELEATVDMPCLHPRLKETAAAIVGDEKNIRKAAYLIARYVYSSLTKGSPNVGQASALQILDEKRGDCSEHALLFVALCRSAGIPARRCSGYVCIGSLWGGHAWAEIWAGKWIGADPTTGEVGTAARYLFHGYPDQPNSYPGVVSTRIGGRLRILTTHVEEGGDSYDLRDPSKHLLFDHENRRYVHVLAGIEARDVPKDWSVTVLRHNMMQLRAEGLNAQIVAHADQGADLASLRRRMGNQPIVETTFGESPALVLRRGGMRYYIIHARRRVVSLQIMEGSTQLIAQLEKVLAPTFAKSPPAYEPKKKAEPKKDDDAEK